MYNANRWVQGAARREPSPAMMLAEKGMYLDQLRAKGYFILERLASDQIIDRVSSELEPWFAATPQ